MRIAEDLEHETVPHQASEQANTEPEFRPEAKLGQPTPGPADAVARARDSLNIERTLDRVTNSLFDVISSNETGPATTLATEMLNDFEEARDAVQVAFEQARTEFDSYDGSQSPRIWMLRYVAKETLRRSTMQSDAASGGDAPQSDGPGGTLHSPSPESRLAVILTESMGMTAEAAADICGWYIEELEMRLAEARGEIGEE